jgi:carbohydrate-binding DOMON domain-containing protein
LSNNLIQPKGGKKSYSLKCKLTEEHHEELVKGLYEQMKPILDASEQPIFIYLDDNHKACNQKFASMLGFKSPKEWAEKQCFLEVYVTEKSRETLLAAYWTAMQKMVASTIPMTWMKKDGASIDSTMILVPMFFQGHMFSVHFVTIIGNK